MTTLTLASERPAACFICSLPERLEGHIVCMSCHDESRCTVCHPHLKYRGEAEHQHIHHGAER